MTSPRGAAPRPTGLAIAGIAAIPFASVTVAARLGDAASSTDPRTAIAGGIALLGGVFMGLLVRRMVTSVDRRLRGAVRLVAAVLAAVPGALVDPLVSAGRSVAGVPTPAPVFVPAETGRRGPPVRLR